MESLADHGYSDIDFGIKVGPFLQGIKSTESEAAVNVVQAQPEESGEDFDGTMPYLGQMVTHNCYNMHSVHIAKTGSQ